MKESARIWASVAENEMDCIKHISLNVERIKELAKSSNRVLKTIQFPDEILFNSIDDHLDEFLVGITMDGKSVITDSAGDLDKIGLEDLTIAFKIKILEQLEDIK